MEIRCPVCGRLVEIEIYTVPPDYIINTPSAKYAKFCCPGCGFELKSERWMWEDSRTGITEIDLVKEVIERVERLRTLDRREVLKEGYMQFDRNQKQTPKSL